MDEPRFNTVPPLPKPALGPVPLFHLAYEGDDLCRFCGKFIRDWKPMEQCPERLGNCQQEESIKGERL